MICSATFCDPRAEEDDAAPGVDPDRNSNFTGPRTASAFCLSGSRGPVFWGNPLDRLRVRDCPAADFGKGDEDAGGPEVRGADCDLPGDNDLSDMLGGSVGCGPSLASKCWP